MIRHGRFAHWTVFYRFYHFILYEKPINTGCPVISGTYQFSKIGDCTHLEQSLSPPKNRFRLSHPGAEKVRRHTLFATDLITMTVPYLQFDIRIASLEVDVFKYQGHNQVEFRVP